MRRGKAFAASAGVGLLASFLAAGSPAGAAQLAPPVAASRIGTPGPGLGDGHSLPPWSDFALKKRADVIQIGTRDAELRAREIVAELDAAFAADDAGKSAIAITRKISRLDYQILKLTIGAAEVESLLAAKTAPSIWDSTFLRVLRTNIADVRSEMFVSRVYFERELARLQLKQGGAAARR